MPDIEISDIGSRVTVTGYDCSGTIRFVGKHATEKSKRVGVELDEPIGKNNGSVKVKCTRFHTIILHVGYFKL